MPKTRSSSTSLQLRLYIAGRAPNSMRAIVNARVMCDEHFPGQHDLEIVDLMRHPDRGLIDGISVTPTLLKLQPLPVARLIGDLSDARQLLTALTAT